MTLAIASGVLRASRIRHFLMQSERRAFPRPVQLSAHLPTNRSSCKKALRPARSVPQHPASSIPAAQPMSENCNKRPLEVPVPTSGPVRPEPSRIPRAIGGDPQLLPRSSATRASMRMRTNIQGEFRRRSPKIDGCVPRRRHFHRLHQGNTALSDAQLKPPIDVRLIFRSLHRTLLSMVPWQRYQRHSHWRHLRC